MNKNKVHCAKSKTIVLLIFEFLLTANAILSKIGAHHNCGKKLLISAVCKA